MRNFAEATGSRSLEPQGPADTEPLMRSFHLRVGVVERAKATADGVQHRAYGTAIEDDVPTSLSALVTEAIEAACSYYEDLLNDGEPFRRVRNLTAGPGRHGARAGAQKRAASRAAAAESRDGP